MDGRLMRLWDKFSTDFNLPMDFQIYYLLLRYSIKPSLLQILMDRVNVNGKVKQCFFAGDNYNMKSIPSTRVR